MLVLLLLLLLLKLSSGRNSIETRKVSSLRSSSIISFIARVPVFRAKLKYIVDRTIETQSYFYFCRNLKVATQALLLCVPMILLVGFLTCFAGLSIYAIYRDCDPVASGKIKTYDKILPYFSAERLTPGLIGLVVSGIFSASLSTISAMMNSLAAVALEDYVKPLHRKFGVELTDNRATLLAKTLTVVNGVICLFLALLSKTMGTLIAVAFSVHGAIGGPILGIFTLGMFSETANETGTIIGMITALVVCLWAAFGQPKPSIPRLPVSIDGCANSTALMLADRINSNRYRSFFFPVFFFLQILS